MEFFQNQQLARRHTTAMSLMFLAAVAAIVLGVNIVGAFIYAYFTDLSPFPPGRVLAATPRSAYVVTTVVVVLAIAAGTIKRMVELSSGGGAVAALLGAERIKRDAQQPQERRLLNIVEEMALASGVIVPQVYVMDELYSINAFAAGYSPNEAVIVVTRGAMEKLNRDELQGVVGHEFSHILNGDMRLNIHLMGVIAGIVTIGAFGSFLMRIGRGGGGNEKGGAVPVFLVGLVIWLIGAIGVFAGRVIKAAISRQREFLADASAVQFTRNPEGIAGALYKIGKSGSFIGARYAEEVSHMCIGSPTGNFTTFNMLLTHPPIEQRIERILGWKTPLWLRERSKRASGAAQVSVTDDSPAAAELHAAQTASPVINKIVEPASALAQGANLVGDSQAALVASIGNPSAAHVERARSFLAELPTDLHAAVGNADGARAVLAALLLGDGEVRVRQLDMVRTQVGEAIALRAASFALTLNSLGPRARMPLFDLSMPSLKRMDTDARHALLRLLKDVAEADGKISMSELVLYTLCRQQLGSEKWSSAPVKYRGVDAVANEAGLILSLLAHAGSGAPAFEKGMTALGMRETLRAPAELRIGAIEKALRELKLLAPMKKSLAVNACLEVAMADGKLTIAEGELMRAICAALDAPLPPLV